MPYRELIPELTPELVALARLLKVTERDGAVSELAIDTQCKRRPCQNPAGCKVHRCRRNRACHLAELAGWPWPLPGVEPGTLLYRKELWERVDALKRKRAVLAMARPGFDDLVLGDPGRHGPVQRTPRSSRI